MKKLFAVLMALGLVGFMACSAPATEGEAEGTEESSAVVEEMQTETEAATETEMAEEGTEAEAATEGTETATEEQAQ